jgi:hypothetical protein
VFGHFAVVGLFGHGGEVLAGGGGGGSCWSMERRCAGLTAVLTRRGGIFRGG